MRQSDRRRTLLCTLVRSAAVWLVLAGLAWLDRDGCILAQRADLFSAIWAGIVIVSDVLGTVGGAIATTLEGVVLYLASAFAWIAHAFATFLVSTGGMFAKVWEGVKIVWNDALKPALLWVDDHLQRFSKWLKDTFKPVFEFLDKVHKHILDFYKTYLSPIIDTIEFVQALDRVLQAFHIRVLQSIDAVLQQIKQDIEAPFLWINQKLVEIWNALDLVVTAGGLFQRLTLLRSLKNYEPHWFALWWNDQIDPNKTSGSDYERTRIMPVDAPFANATELARFYRGEGSRVDEQVKLLVADWREGVGLDPPSADY